MNKKYLENWQKIRIAGKRRYVLTMGSLFGFMVFSIQILRNFFINGDFWEHLIFLLVSLGFGYLITAYGWQLNESNLNKAKSHDLKD